MVWKEWLESHEGIEDLYSKLEEGFQHYVLEKVGPEMAEKVSPFGLFERTVGGFKALKAIREIILEYDHGIELAKDGLFLGYLCSLYGLDTRAVKLSRRGRGATWKPLEPIPDLNGKRVLVLDNDAITGRTLRRAGRELQSMGPKRVDLMLMFSSTPLGLDCLKKYGEHLLNVDEVMQKSKPNVVDYDLDAGKYWSTKYQSQCKFCGDKSSCRKCSWVEEYDAHVISVDCEVNVPDTIQRRFFVSRFDIQDIDRDEIIKELEAKLCQSISSQQT
ncbi:phosphoribosyltransferase [Candidatus Woesearchaeota archaeon]|nr:phosphoribosyltransferase [Candidatus Woesearchaeota archaeon]